MASLSKEMRNKRDVKRTPSLLIVDSDVGNMGLYKSILATEYEMDIVFDIRAALEKTDEKKYDAIVLDDDFEKEEIIAFLAQVNQSEVGQVVCLISDKKDEVFMVKALCSGVYRIIDKPFTREGLSNAIYEEIKRRRDAFVKKHILIVDEDLNNLKEMKKVLGESFYVVTMNCCDTSLRYINKYHPDLIIADASMADMAGIKMCAELEKNKEDFGESLLFMTDNPSEECVLKCAQFKPEGFLVKPMDMDQLLSQVERIFLVETYSRKNN